MSPICMCSPADPAVVCPLHDYKSLTAIHQAEWVDRVEITEPRTVGETDGASMIMTHAVNQLYELGYGPPEGASPFYYKDNIICARLVNRIIGFIAYRYEKGDGTNWVMLGWVGELFRKQGVYRRLWNKLVEVSRKEGAARIAGSTHVDNKAMRQFYNKMGRVETHVQSYYTIPKIAESSKTNCEQCPTCHSVRKDQPYYYPMAGSSRMIPCTDRWHEVHIHGV